MGNKGLLYAGLVVGMAYFATDYMKEKVDELKVVNVSASQASSEGISVQQFYPVLALDTSEGSGRTGSIDDAFFVAPPEADIEFENQMTEPATLESTLDVMVVVIPPLPEPEPIPDPIDPINFLPDFEKVFRVQATMPEQNSVIMNGWAYKEGDTLPIRLPVSYEDEHGNVQQEQLLVRLTSVQIGQVVLTSETAAGWEQSLVISL